MRILVIGGSSFVGRHISARAVEEGHSVSLFNRGRTSPDGVAGTEHLEGDRNADLSSLSGREWDACIDVCAYVPRQVRSLLEAVGDRIDRYAFISTVSVYDPEVPAGYDEAAKLVDPSYEDELTIELYGELKVGCELTALDLAGDRVTIVRPGYVVGPFDRTHRFAYWVERVAAGGTILGPDGHQPLQVIDGRDLAAFVVGLVESGTPGAFNGAAPDPTPSFAATLEGIALGLGLPAPEVVWGGPRQELPLSAPPENAGLLAADLTRPVAHGLRWRPLAETVADTAAWLNDARASGRYETPATALSPERERELLA
jgi:2'-hydroxyisoflavone reductase